MTIVAGTSVVEVTPVPDGGWCVHDASCDEHDPARVIAYVERAGVGFDVVWVRSPHPTARRFETLDAVCAAAADLIERPR